MPSPASSSDGPRPLWLEPASLLRSGSALFPDRQTVPLRRLVLWILLAGMFYGVVMGTFSGLDPGHRRQLVYSGVKVPILLLATFLLSLPSFFVLNTLAGLRSDFRDAVQALLITQAGLTLILASLAPYTAFWYASSANYNAAVAVNAVMFGTASVTAQLLLLRAYRPLIARDPRHRWMLRLWIGLYAFVGIQLGWVLRPFIGNPGVDVQFLRPDSLDDNAYVVVFNLLWGLLIGTR